MSISIEYKKSAKYLLASIQGYWTLGNVEKALEEIKSEADKQETKLILIDGQGFSLPDSFITRFYTGVKIAQLFCSYKISIYMQSEKFTKFTENVAANRGATINVCENEEDAINWLH